MVSHHWVGPHGMRTKIHQQILKDGRLEADRALSFAESGLDVTGVLISSRGWMSPIVFVAIRPQTAMSHLNFLLLGLSRWPEGDGRTLAFLSILNTCPWVNVQLRIEGRGGELSPHSLAWPLTVPQDCVLSPVTSLEQPALWPQLPRCGLCPPMCPVPPPLGSISLVLLVS